MTTGKERILGEYTALSLTTIGVSKADIARSGLGPSSTTDVSGVAAADTTAGTDVTTGTSTVGVGVGVLGIAGDAGIATSAVFFGVFFLGAQNMDVKASSLPARDLWIGAAGLFSLRASVEVREVVEIGTEKSDPIE